MHSTHPPCLVKGFHQRELGCFNGGKTGLYIDTNGELNACPFCHSKNGSILDDNFEENLKINFKKSLLSISGIPNISIFVCFI